MSWYVAKYSYYFFYYFSHWKYNKIQELMKRYGEKQKSRKSWYNQLLTILEQLWKDTQLSRTSFDKKNVFFHRYKSLVRFSVCQKWLDMCWRARYIALRQRVLHHIEFELSENISSKRSLYIDKNTSHSSWTWKQEKMRQAKRVAAFYIDI